LEFIALHHQLAVLQRTGTPASILPPERATVLVIPIELVGKLAAQSDHHPVPAQNCELSRKIEEFQAPSPYRRGACILQVDGYAAYKALARNHGGSIQLAFCLAHARRRFVKVYKLTHSPFAREVIERIGAIYAIEAEIRGTSAQRRLEARQLRSRPLMDTLRSRLIDVVDQFSSQSPLTEAINYTLNHWNGLTLFLTDGRVEVDSNTVERSMRPIALGRKNSLFAGSEGGAESWSILASLVTTAKLAGLDPQAYLTDVLERIVSGRTKSHQLHELLAWNWKAARERTERAVA
jgi:transposase